MFDYSSIHVSISNHIGHIVLNRPDEHNKMTDDFWRELPAAIKALDDALARVIVISSEGKHYTAGLDLSLAGNIATDTRNAQEINAFKEVIMRFQSTFTAIETARVPVIATIQGGCIGGGVSLISACDIRYCTNDAFFSIEETNIGITCDVGALQRLPHIISDTHLREWTYTGNRIYAEKAEQIGLVSNVYNSQETMLEAAMETAKTIASKSPLVIHGCKDSLNYVRDHSTTDSLERLALWNAGMINAHDVMQSMSQRSGAESEFRELSPRTKPY